jgi:hypothetical protein
MRRSVVRRSRGFGWSRPSSWLDGVELEMATGQAAIGGSLTGSASTSGGVKFSPSPRSAFIGIGARSENRELLAAGYDVAVEVDGPGREIDRNPASRV